MANSAAAANPSEPFFLRFPYKIRRRIYEFAALINSSGFFALPKPDPYFNPRAAWDSKHQRFYKRGRLDLWYPLPNQLFYVSHAVSDDALSVFYSEHSFSCGDYYGMCVLNTMGAKAFSSFTAIDIRVRPSTRENFASRRELREYSFLFQWEMTLSLLSDHLPKQAPRLRLSLELYLEKKDVELAALSLLLKLPTLKECSILLRGGTDHRLQRYLEVIINQVTRQSSRTIPTFRIGDLPSELYTKILEHTDLLAPDIVTWKNNRGYVLKSCIKGPCLSHEYPYDGKSQWCHVFDIAHTSVNPCWKVPNALFQTNRKMREDSRYLFLKNKFLSAAHPLANHYDWEWDVITMTPTFLPRLRYLILSFPELHINDYQAGSHHLASWIATLDLLARNSQLECLTLELQLERDDKWGAIGFQEPDEGEDLPVDLEIEQTKWETYKEIIEPTCRLAGLENLFIHIGWPVADEKEPLRHEQERILERMVMGEGYHSFIRGKCPVDRYTLVLR